MSTGHEILDTMSREPSQVFNTHAKQIEMANLGTEFTIKVNEAPLVLFSKDKAKAALDWDIQQISHDFRMPFKACTVVDNVSAVSFLDSSYITPETEPEIFEHIWNSLDGVGVDSARDMTRKKKWEGPAPQEAIGVTVIVSMDTVAGLSIFHLTGGSIVVNTVGKYRTFCMATHVALLIKAGKVIEVYDGTDRKIPNELTRDATTNTFTALGQLSYLSKSPDIILEVTPGKIRSPETAKKVTRAHERPQIIMIDPEELRKIRPPQGGTHASPVPHTRRGHKRTYRHPRYKNMVGKTVWIDQIDVKCGEPWRFGKKTYVVMDKTEEKPDAENNEAGT